MVDNTQIIVDNKNTSYTGDEALNLMSEALNYNDFLFSLIEKILRTKTNNKVLDFGAGLGIFAKMLKKDTFNTIVDCVEIDEVYSENLRKDGFVVYNDITIINDKEQYDLIYSFNVLEHIENDVEILENLQQLLTTNGKLILYVPAYQILYSNFDKKLGHKRRYSKKDLVKKIKNAGFEIIKVEYADMLGFLSAAIFKILVNSDKLNKKTLKFYDKYIFPISSFLDKIGFKYLFGKNILLIARQKGNN